MWPLEAVFVVSGDNLHHPFIIITVSSPRTRLFMRDRLEESEQERDRERRCGRRTLKTTQEPPRLNSITLAFALHQNKTKQ